LSPRDVTGRGSHSNTCAGLSLSIGVAGLSSTEPEMSPGVSVCHKTEKYDYWPRGPETKNELWWRRTTANYQIAGPQQVRHSLFRNKELFSWIVYSTPPFRFTFILQTVYPRYRPGVYSASNRNDCQKQNNNVSVEQSAAGA
jgi:hypothetical protein